MLGELRDRLERAVREGVFPGCVAGVLIGGEKYTTTVGYMTYDHETAIEQHFLYDVASVTKTVPLALAFLRLVDRNELLLETRVVDVLPEFNTEENKRDVTLWHLLTYTLDLKIGSLSNFRDTSADEIIHAVLTAPLRSAPGNVYQYANSTALLLSLFLERRAGKSLDAIAREEVFNPLEMSTATFTPEIEIGPVVPTEIDMWRGREIRGDIHDESAYALKERHRSGIAGLFCSINDLFPVCEMMLGGGSYHDYQFLRGALFAEAVKNQTPNLTTETALGFERNRDHFMGTAHSGNSVGKTGFTGCSFVCDLGKKRAVILLSNRTYPHRPQTADAINEVRRDIANLVFQDV